MITTSADHGRAAVQQALVVAEEPEGATRTTASSTATSENLVRLLREALACSSASRSPGFSISRLQVGRSDLVQSRRPSGSPAPSNRLRLWASAARTARPCGESRLELTFQTLGR